MREAREERGEARGKLTILVSQFTFAMLGCCIFSERFSRFNFRMVYLFGAFLKIQF
jgi:hypothetical protein